ncbi:MAG: WIAG-tail domain, partial [Paenibacillus sp.]|nr:WIAG-tail domain [Paenibacillus sp.]
TEQAIGSIHLADEAVTASHLADNSVTAKAIAANCVKSEHIAEGTISADKLDFSPIQTVPSSQKTLQQFGLAPFKFGPHEEKVEISIQLEQPFASSSYVIVAMTNHEAYCAVLKEQTADMAILTILRMRFSPEPSGLVHWIAVGQQV